ncbi:uncharacterized protein METZ01_LOCUS361786 [marine metagenome]|uniref:Uncharacterized protein n=1 Tax=marine metagenome TaxID=408172 RepID=A0A382SH74_9ZZZZ
MGVYSNIMGIYGRQIQFYNLTINSAIKFTNLFN